MIGDPDLSPAWPLIEQGTTILLVLLVFVSVVVLFWNRWK
jgi:hypothetical protein